jgi:hypothetical protein
MYIMFFHLRVVIIIKKGFLKYIEKNFIHIIIQYLNPYCDINVIINLMGMVFPGSNTDLTEYLNNFPESGTLAWYQIQQPILPQHQHQMINYFISYHPRKKNDVDKQNLFIVKTVNCFLSFFISKKEYHKKKLIIINRCHNINIVIILLYIIDNTKKKHQIQDTP